MVRRANLARLSTAAIGPGSEEFQASTGGGLEKEEQMSRKTYMIALGLAGVLSIGSLGAYQAAALPISAATMKAAVPSDITDVRGGARVGGVRAGGYRAAGVRAGGYRGGAVGYRGGAVGYRGGAVGYRGGAVGYRGGAVAYRGGAYRGGAYGYRPWGAAAAGAAVGAAAAGAASSYYYG